jgi:IS6 family transposase
LSPPLLELDECCGEAKRREASVAISSAPRHHSRPPVEVTTDKAPAYPPVLDELAPVALHVAEQYADNAVEADHGRLKARLRPMRTRTAPVSPR